MVNHLCLITYKDAAAVDAAKQQAIEDAYLSLPGIIDGITSMQVGRDLGLLEGNADLAILATFRDAAAFRAYSTHDAHATVIYPVLGEIAAGWSTAQF